MILKVDVNDQANCMRICCSLPTVFWPLRWRQGDRLPSSNSTIWMLQFSVEAECCFIMLSLSDLLMLLCEILPWTLALQTHQTIFFRSIHLVHVTFLCFRWSWHACQCFHKKKMLSSRKFLEYKVLCLTFTLSLLFTCAFFSNLVSFLRFQVKFQPLHQSGNHDSQWLHSSLHGAHLGQQASWLSASPRQVV